MKLRPLTLVIASLLSVHTAFAADESTAAGTGKQAAAPAQSDIAQWQSSQASVSAPQQVQQQQAQQQVQQAQQAQQQQVQQLQQQQVQQRPTTDLPAAPAQTQPQMPVQQNMTQVDPNSLEPLPPPLKQSVEPITPGQIRSVNKQLNAMSAATNYKFVTPVPRISSQTVSLSAGASIPQVRVYPNVTTIVTFSDITGHPWKLAAPPFNSSPCPQANGQGSIQGNGTLCVNYIPGSSVFSIQPVSEYATGNVSVMLTGLPIPVMINVKSMDPSANTKTVDVDYRLDLRIPKRGPDSPVYTATPEKKISLYDKQLQLFLDGIPPDEARTVKLNNAPAGTRVWQIGDDLYVRSQLQLQDEFEKTLSAIDGTHVYVLPATPVLTFSENGRARDVDVELN